MNIPILISLRTVKRMVILLVISVIGLSGAFSAINYLVKRFSDWEPFVKFIQRFFAAFFVGAEYNFPTWYSSFSLLVAAGLFAMIAYLYKLGQERNVLHWIGLSLGFAVMSLDEYVGAHENTAAYLRKYIDLPGRSWLILGLMIVAVVGLFYWRFVLELHPQTRRLIFLAAGVYLFGAIGLEALGNLYVLYFGEANIGYELFIYAEEAFEMAGVAILIYSLMSHLAFYLAGKGLVVTIEK